VAGSIYQGTFHLPSVIPANCEIELLYAVMPNTVYTFNGDVFTFEEAAGGPKSTTLTGSYTGVALATYLTTWMTANSTALTAYSVTYNVTTGKFEFVSVTAHTITVASANLGVRLGFAVGTTASTATHTSTNVCNLSPPKICLLQFDQLQMDKKVEQSTAGPLGHFIIPMTGDSFSHIDYFSKSEFTNKIKNKDPLQHIQYSLYEPEGRQLLQLQNDWSLVLEVK